MRLATVLVVILLGGCAAPGDSAKGAFDAALDVAALFETSDLMAVDAWERDQATIPYPVPNPRVADGDPDDGRSPHWLFRFRMPEGRSLLVQVQQGEALGYIEDGTTWTTLPIGTWVDSVDAVRAVKAAAPIKSLLDRHQMAAQYVLLGAPATVNREPGPPTWEVRFFVGDELRIAGQVDAVTGCLLAVQGEGTEGYTVPACTKR